MVDGAALPPTTTAPRVVPPLLAFVAGAVDACTFLAIFGLFVAQLTGSFVTVAAQAVRRDPAALIHLLALPLFFLAGVAIVVLARPFGRRALAVALAVETALLGAFTAVGLTAAPFASASAPTALVASGIGLMAMGVQSTAVRFMLPDTPSTNVMTTNTTQLAIDLAQWLISRLRGSAGAAEGAAAARRLGVLAPIMAGFFVGAVAGAVGFTYLGFWCLLPLIGILLGLVAWATRRR